jgi:ABC-type dipeptide/oligopeptide/nickel transport system permease subunit
MGNNDAAWIFPSLFLTILILAFTFLGDGIRDAVDPRSK